MPKKFRNMLVLLIYTAFFCFVLIGAQSSALAQSLEGGRLVSLNIDGRPMPVMDVSPVIVQNRTFVPVRHVFEYVGAIVDFHAEQSRIMIVHGDNLIVMHIGQYDFLSDGRTFLMDVAPQIINDRTMVPLSFVAAAMGFEVGWDNENSIVHLTSPGHIPETPGEIPNETPNAHHYEEDLIEDYEPEGRPHEGVNFAELSTDNSAPIPSESNALTTANSITWNDERTQFTISATSRITSVEWYMHDDGRLRVDIFNARAAFAPSIHAINNDFLTNIRTGHNYIHGATVARVVFDLQAPVVYRVALSYDRRHVVVTFEPNQITDISFSPTFAYNGLESLVIQGITTPCTDIFLLSEPPRLVVDLPNSRMAFDGVLGGGVLAAGVRHGQFDGSTSRIVVDLARAVSFTVEHDHEAATVTIHLSEPTYRNIYHNAESGITSIRRPPGLDMSQIAHFDEYLLLRHILTLPGDFSEFYGYGMYWIREGPLNYIEIVTEEYSTSIILHTNRIKALIITQDEWYIHIRAVNPRETHPFIVLLDPGHGGAAPGAVHHGVRESDLVLEISLMVLDILHRDGIVKVYTTRYTDKTVANSHRAAMANDIADIFVSVHANAANSRATGTETLYAIHPAETELGFNSRDMAQIFQDNLVYALGTIDRGLVHRPGIQVLNSTQIPAVLLEIEFMDAPDGAARLACPNFRMRAAEAIVQSIYDVMVVYQPPRNY
ncbi:MAG: N-acetylmuramoyl-L-alanine amidase family protein [Clostridiales bacterium]|jgi:N-acetylmuramoyl-L-alanine amidase|nr:N-acetylmuramoyl-L-alanine amidase family protein [Clostridiales bacterium]